MKIERAAAAAAGSSGPRGPGCRRGAPCGGDVLMPAGEGSVWKMAHEAPQRIFPGVLLQGGVRGFKMRAKRMRQITHF